MRVRAPGKLIISGEHAVVYGHPALAMAVQHYVTTATNEYRDGYVNIQLKDFGFAEEFSFAAISAFKNHAKNNYQRYLNGEYPIQQVLTDTSDLTKVALALCLEKMSNLKGLQIQIESDIPVGCGVGSSAATAMSVVYAVANHYESELSQEELFAIALEAENMQHGKASGLDLQISLRGGCCFSDGQHFHKRMSPVLPMFAINTGAPDCTTGQCVAAVAPMMQDKNFRQQFEEVTFAADKALQENNIGRMMLAIKKNHQLLCEINVVPKKVKTFIAEIESLSGAAKICGAGAICGEKGGMVLALIEDASALKAVCEAYQYSLTEIKGEARGIHFV